MEQKAHYRVSDILACGVDQKQSFFCPGREESSIVETKDFELYRAHPLFINILKYIKSVWALNENLCHLDIALAYLRAIFDLEVAQNHIFDDIHRLHSEEGHIMLFLECSAELTTDITIATIEELRHIILVSSFATLFSFSASVFAIGRPSFCVIHCIS